MGGHIEQSQVSPVVHMIEPNKDQQSYLADLNWLKTQEWVTLRPVLVARATSPTGGLMRKSGCYFKSLILGLIYSVVLFKWQSVRSP